LRSVAFGKSSAARSAKATTATASHSEWVMPLTNALVGVGTALIVAFVVQQRRAREPLIPSALLREREFRAAAAVLGLSTFALFGTLWFLTLYLQDVRGYTPIGAPGAARSRHGRPAVGIRNGVW
jgi:hypothetical protein